MQGISLCKGYPSSREAALLHVSARFMSGKIWEGGEFTRQMALSARHELSLLL